MDRTKKNYFEDESKAVDVRDKATDAEDKAKGRKKDMMSFFQSTATLKRHAGKLSAKQEELDIRYKWILRISKNFQSFLQNLFYRIKMLNEFPAISELDNVTKTINRMDYD